MTPTQFKTLMKQKLVTPLTEMQNSQLEKYLFQNYLLWRPADIEEGLWKIYVNFGRGKFRNLTYEKGIKDGTVTMKDIIESSGYSHLSSGWCFRLEIISSINQWIGFHNSQEYGHRVTKDKIEQVIKLFESNRKRIHVAFDIRDRTKGDLNTKTCLSLINKVLNKWGYSQVKRGKQKHKRVNGKKVDISDYQVVGKGNDDLDIYKYIKPREKPKASSQGPLHPLLRDRKDKNIITEAELEEIRLNTSM